MSDIEPYTSADTTVTRGASTNAPTSSPRWCSRPRANATNAITSSAPTITPSQNRIIRGPPRLDGVALERTGHAVPAAAALAELEPLDRDDLDARLAHLRDRPGVPFVGDDDTGLHRDDVVAVVPLLARLLVDVASGLDDLQVLHAHRVRDRAEERRLLGDVEAALGGAGPQADRPDLVHHLRVHRHLVAVEHREDRVEVHVRAVLRHHDRDHALGGALGEQRAGDLLDHPRLRPLAEPDQDGAVAD